MDDQPINQQSDLFRQLLADLDLPRVPQQDRSRQKRDALLAAASGLFAERGYEATTADDIAAAAEVSIGTFYSYFRNKRQLFLTLYAKCLERIDSLQIDQADFEHEPREAIRAMIKRALDREPVFYGLQRVWNELLPKDDDVREYNDRLNRIICQQVKAAICRIAAKGMAWPDLLIDETCWTITLLLDTFWSTFTPEAQTPQELERQRTAIADMVYRAVFKQ